MRMGYGINVIEVSSAGGEAELGTQCYTFYERENDVLYVGRGV